MFEKLFGKFSKDMGIDLGTSRTRVYVREKGILIDEPSIVALNIRTDQILAVGEDARKMVGRTPGHINVVQPLIHGVISDFEVTEKMLRYFIDRVHQEQTAIVPRPRVVIGVPLDMTEVERKAVEDAAVQAGARQVYLVQETLAAAVGARLPIQEAIGTLLVDIGGGTAEVAVISLGGIVISRSLKIAGGEFDEAIVQYIREKSNLLIGRSTAEEIKIRVGSVVPQTTTIDMKVRGRDLLSGLPREITITNREVQESLWRSVRLIIENIRDTIEATPPELVADIHRSGVLLTGGSALLRGLPDLIAEEMKIPVSVVDDPLTAVVRGAGILLEDEPLLMEIALPQDTATAIRM